MSLITCLGSCKYQKNGYCSLDSIISNTVKWENSAEGDSCIYYSKKEPQERSSQKQSQKQSEYSSDGFSNIVS